MSILLSILPPLLAPPTPLHATDVFLSHSNRQESTCIKKSPAFPQEWCTKHGLHTADAKASPSASSSLRHMDLERLKSEACLAWFVHTTLEEREPAVYELKKSVCKLKNKKSYIYISISWQNVLKLVLTTRINRKINII